VSASVYLFWKNIDTVIVSPAWGSGSETNALTDAWSDVSVIADAIPLLRKVVRSMIIMVVFSVVFIFPPWLYFLFS
jgi:hypothetical protein